MVRNRTQFISFVALLASLGVVGCAEDAPLATEVIEFKELPTEQLHGKATEKAELPHVKAFDAADVFIQKLPEPTAAGENVAVHILLPAPANKELDGSLVRVVGDPERPLVLFRSDALVELGRLKQSPGEQFFTAFVRLDDKQLEQRAAMEAKLGKSKTGVKDRIIFDGRTPIAITTGIKFDLDVFEGGGPVPLGPCPIQPLSEQARWDEALVITDLHVVQDPDRTNDVCDPGADNPDGVWTFKHLMAEMSAASGLSTHDFVVHWLSNWLTDSVVNGDLIEARTTMFDRVIKPWADASGINAALDSNGALHLDGELELKLAPFRLSAIVNRIDLGATVSGPAGYGGGSTDQPTTAGEMRFVFGVQNLDNCSVLPFSVIFEYGVPITGCDAVKQWAIDWTELSDPSLPAFSDPWREHLEHLSQTVVVAGAAPDRGNKSAINQVRTNENGLNKQWQFREFTLTSEDPITDIDTPVNGPLRPHTVAMTPDDTEYDDFSDSRIDDFVFNVVRPAVSPSVGVTSGALGPVLTDCAPSFSVPQLWNGDEFRGGDSFTADPVRWRVDSADQNDLRDICAREQFSVNTCNGCHFADTDTSFFHVDPTSSPAPLSNFMTGGGGIWTVPDQQFGQSIANMEFQDLERRHNRLYEIACAQCGDQFGVKPHILDVMHEVAGVVPIDPLGGEKAPFPVGPITGLDAVEKLLAATAELTDPKLSRQLELGKLVRARQTFVH